MRSLLDTHVFLWFITGDERLSTKARRIIEEPESDVLLSVVSIWEMAIKVGLGRLPLPLPLRRLVPREMAKEFHPASSPGPGPRA